MARSFPQRSPRALFFGRSTSNAAVDLPKIVFGADLREISRTDFTGTKRRPVESSGTKR